MATPAKGKRTKAPVAPADQTPSEAVAARVMARFGDLKPSVERIMSSGLDEDGRMRAISLFEESLGMVGDPNRDPAVAIEAGRLAQADTPVAG